MKNLKNNLKYRYYFRCLNIVKYSMEFSFPFNLILFMYVCIIIIIIQYTLF